MLFQPPEGLENSSVCDLFLGYFSNLFSVIVGIQYYSSLFQTHSIVIRHLYTLRSDLPKAPVATDRHPQL